MEENICKFAPTKHIEKGIDTINFVWEKNGDLCKNAQIRHIYSINLVIEGDGIFIISGVQYNIKKGDIFFIFPSVEFQIISKNNLQYIYISFLGIRSNKILESLKISKKAPYYESYVELIDFWMDSLLKSRSGNIDMLSESVLLYTFSIMGNDLLDNRKSDQNNEDIVTLIKQYADTHFFDSYISLERISKKFLYNKKYIGTAFKKSVGTGFNQYINTLRVQNACTLIEEGITSIKEISSMCGFSDQMYFSKVFKKLMGVTPSEHIKNINK